MHLHFIYDRPRPNTWVVIDDFGTEHDALYNGKFGRIGDPAFAARSAFAESGLFDPDYARPFWSVPKTYHARESVTFASPIGLSIELDVRIDFSVEPAWDELNNQPQYSQAEGATIKVLRAETDCWDFSPNSVVLTQKAIEAFW